MYMTIVLSMNLSNINAVYSKYSTHLYFVFLFTLTTRSSIFDTLNKYYEDENYVELVLDSFNVILPLEILVSLTGIVMLVIAYDFFEMNKLDEHEFKVEYRSEEEFKKILYSLKDRGIKVFDDRVVRKNKKINVCKIKFYDIKYKQAVLYFNEFYGDVKYSFKKVYIILGIIFVLDILVTIYRLYTNNFISILDLIKY